MAISIHSPAGEMKTKSASATNPGDKLTVATYVGFVAGKDPARVIPAGEEFVLLCNCGPTYKIDAQSATVPDTTALSAELDYTDATQVVTTGTGGLFCVQAFTQGDSHAYVITKP